MIPSRAAMGIYNFPCLRNKTFVFRCQKEVPRCLSSLSLQSSITQHKAALAQSTVNTNDTYTEHLLYKSGNIWQSRVRTTANVRYYFKSTKHICYSKFSKIFILRGLHISNRMTGQVACLNKRDSMHHSCCLALIGRVSLCLLQPGCCAFSTSPETNTKPNDTESWEMLVEKEKLSTTEQKIHEKHLKAVKVKK